jgi:uncharacterized membrane protein (DUF373 family)
MNMIKINWNNYSKFLMITIIYSLPLITIIMLFGIVSLELFNDGSISSGLYSLVFTMGSLILFTLFTYFNLTSKHHVIKGDEVK